MNRYFRIYRHAFSSIDLIRFAIIGSLSVFCLIIAIQAITQNLGTLYAQLIYFPIIYAACFYPRREL